MIKPDTLRRLISYDPATGILTWKHREREFFTSDWQCNAWNARYAGAVCGKISQGYVRIKIFGQSYAGHRIAWAIHFGVHPSLMIDHINGVRNDNRIANLRDVSSTVNARNRCCPHCHKSLFERAAA
jgi:hypothetical protein